MHYKINPKSLLLDISGDFIHFIIHEALILSGRTYKRRRSNLRTYTAVIEKCPDTGLFVGYIPGMRGAHSQGETLDELNRNLKEVVELLLEDGEPKLDAEFVGTQNVVVA
jgi:predicted RNase H-like HicB family nuclease